MTIGPRRRSSPFVALALTVGLVACGGARTQKTAQGAPPDGRVPADAHALTVTRGYQGLKPSLAMTTTSPRKVRVIAAMLDRLRPARPGVVNCRNIPVAPAVTFVFRAERNGPALARASTLTSGPQGDCPGVTFMVRGHARESLSAQPGFLRRAGRVLGSTVVSK